MTPLPPARLALAIQAALLLSLAGVASAQDAAPVAPDAEQAQTLDTVTVTGTRIKKAELESQVPVQVLTREDIDRSGFTSVADIVQNLTASGAALNTKFNSSGNFGFPPDGGGVGAGAATVDLRHLGSKRVLVLVDGVRWINESSASGVGSSVDLNTIPLSIIDRIEVLEDGASSIYGSDAIAGVVNIITRRSIDGVKLDFNYGDYDDLAGGETYGADLGWGGSTDRWQWFLGASYYKQKQVVSSEYGPASVPVPGTGLANGSSATPQGRMVFQDPNTGVVYDITPNTGVSDPQFNPGETGCERTDDFHCFATEDRFNFAPYNLLLTPSERKSVFGQVRFDFTPTFSGHAKVLYNQRESANQAAPEPFFLGTDAGVYNDYAERTLVISALNPYNPFGFDLTTAGPDANLFLLGRRPVEAANRAAPCPFFLGTGCGVSHDYAERTLVISALNPDNPFGFDLTTAGPDANLFLLGRRPVEGGPRRYQQEVKTWYASAGVEGMFEVATRPWSWDASVVFSRSRAEQRNTGSYKDRKSTRLNASH